MSRDGHNGHSRYAPSGSDRWAVCQLSLQPVPSSHYINEDDGTDTDFARFGSAAHALGAAAITEQREPADFLLDDRQFHGLDPTVKMVDSVAVYWAWAMDLVRERSYEIFLEHRVEAPSIHEDCEGTADLRAFSEAKSHLVIGDYKSGWQDVDVLSYQFAIYAIGELDTLEDMGYTVERITVVVIQPLNEAEPIRSHDYTTKELRRIARKLAQATKGSAAKAGSHCKYCLHAHYCEVLASHANEALPGPLHGPEDFDEMVVSLTPEMIAEILDRQEAVAIWFAAVAKWAAQLIVLKTEVPGWELRPTKRKRRYTNVDIAESVLLDKFGPDIYEPREIRSPAQIEKIWPSAKALMNGRPGKPGLTERPQAGVTLKRKGTPDE